MVEVEEEEEEELMFGVLRCKYTPLLRQHFRLVLVPSFLTKNYSEGVILAQSVSN